MIEPRELSARLKREALALGFDTVGITTPGAIPDAPARLKAFLQDGFAGDMAWLERNEDARANPAILWPEVRAVVMLGLSYAPGSDSLAALAQKECGAISVYAQGRDYHDILKSQLKTLARWLIGQAGTGNPDVPPPAVKVFVDTAPLMEKPLAHAAGLGWQGKHTNLVSRAHGSWLFLGAILTTVPLTPDAPEPDHCGSCQQCLDVCPTNAFPAPYRLDPRRCIAYLTIEHKGHIAAEFREAIGNRIFGCDDCLSVCPWNKFAVRSREVRLAAGPATNSPKLAGLLALDDTAFRARFAGTPLKRMGRDRFIRNCLIAAGNSGDPSLTGAVSSHLAGPNPIVRAMAVWALRRLDKSAFAQARARAVPRESDADVRAEWNATAEKCAGAAQCQGRAPGPLS